jgi:hypothetical protein
MGPLFPRRIVPQYVDGYQPIGHTVSTASAPSLPTSVWDTTFAAALVLDWKDGDGGTPTVGPTLTVNGSPSTGNATPWGNLTSMIFDASDDYLSGAAVNTDGKDIVAMALVKTAAAFGAVRYALATSTGTSGIQLYGATGPEIIRCRTKTLTNTDVIDLDASPAASSWQLWTLRVDRNLNHATFVNGTPANSEACPAGTITSDATAIGALGTGSGLWNGEIARVQIYHCTDALTDFSNAYIASFATGVSAGVL